MSATVKYKGNVIAALNTDTSATLKTAATILEGDIVVENVQDGTPTLQSKTKSYTPSESAQSETISADTGYDGLDEVEINVGAIPSSYVGSGVTRRSSSDLSASGGTVNAPAGYYESAASKAVASGSAKPAASVSGTGATVTPGTNKLTLSKTVSNTPQVTPGYVAAGTAGNTDVSLEASVTTQAAQTIHPSTSDQTIAASRYLTGVQTIKGVLLTNLSAGNIKSGTVVKVGDSTDDDCVTSVTGTYTGGGGGGGPTLLNTTSIGTVSTTSTQAANLNKDLSVSGINDYDLLIVETSVDTKTNKSKK